jgi:cell division protease FtsH
VFEDISTGAHNDLSKATDIARSMVKEYGMSVTIGQVYFSREKRPLFLEAGMPAGGEYSEATAEMIDKEIKEIISVQYRRALDILGEKKAVMDKGAEVLLEKEKIDGEELKALVGLPGAPSPDAGSLPQSPH